MGMLLIETKLGIYKHTMRYIKHNKPAHPDINLSKVLRERDECESSYFSVPLLIVCTLTL